MDIDTKESKLDIINIKQVDDKLSLYEIIGWSRTLNTNIFIKQSNIDKSTKFITSNEID
jgi:hypothetical protein